MKQRTCATCATSYRSLKCPTCYPQAQGLMASGPTYPQCDWRSGELQCRYPGSLSHSTSGGGPYYCGLHWDCKDPRIGAQIVDASQDYVHWTRSDLEREVEKRVDDHAKGVSMRETIKGITSPAGGGTAWASAILARQEAGEPVTETMISMARKALRI